MSLKLKFTDEHGIVHIDMTPAGNRAETKTEGYITDPKFDTINNRFGQYDLFGGKYDGGDAPQSLFRSRYNSIEEELANTPYAFATERSLRLNTSNDIDITIKSDASPSRDIEDDRFFKRNIDCDVFGPTIDLGNEAFTVTQLIHAQDRYYDLSSRQSNSSGDVSGSVPITRTNVGDGAFKVINPVKAERVKTAAAFIATSSTTRNKREKSFAILTEIPAGSRPTSPRSLPADIRQGRTSPFRGRGFKEETSRHNTPKTSADNSRSCSPPRRRTNSLSRIDKMAQAATLPLPVQLNRSHSPRNFLKENIEEVRELSELNREKNEQEAERARIEVEEALLREMGLLEKKSIRSRSTSRRNSLSKVNLGSRPNSPSAILHFESLPSNSKEFINVKDVKRPKAVMHRSRLRSESKSQPQSNDVSPIHSKIPHRQNSVSPTRTPTRDSSSSRRLAQNKLGKNQRVISSSTSSIHETIRIGSQVHDKRGISKSNQYLDSSPTVIKNKPPISPAKNGPPPSNKVINSKRLSPIVGTPNKNSTENTKPGSTRLSAKPSPVTKKVTGTPAASRVNSRPPSRVASRDPSPDRRTTKPVGTKNTQSKPINRTSNTRTNQSTQLTNKSEEKKPVSRTNSIKSLTRTPSTKTLNEKPPLLKKTNSKKDLTEKTRSNNKTNELSVKKDTLRDNKNPIKSADNRKKTVDVTKEQNKNIAKSTDPVKTDEIKTQDNETQYDKISIDKAELVIMTKKNVVSMTTAAITSQPLEVVATVTNQLPAVLEKARERGIFERLSSKDTLVTKEEETPKETVLEEPKEIQVETSEIKEHIEEKKDEEDKGNSDEKKPIKPIKNIVEKPIFMEDSIKLRPLQPPYNNPQLERVKQKIDDIFKEPEISRENILTASAKSREAMNIFKNVAEKTKNNTKDITNDVAIKLTDIKDQVKTQNEKMVSEIRSEAVKIVDSIITPVEEPKDVIAKIIEVKKDIEPTVVVVNEKKNNIQTDVIQVNESLVKGDAEVEVQSSNISTPIGDKIEEKIKLPDSNGSEKSVHSNGGFPQSTSTTPKPPIRSRRESKKTPPDEETTETAAKAPETKPPNICERIMGKCKSKCCPCCVKGTKDDDSEPRDAEADTKELVKSRTDDDESTKDNDVEPKDDKKMGIMDKINCFKRKKEKEERIREVEMAASKASIEFETETKRKRKLRDMLCCCGQRRRVSDASGPEPRALAPADAGCCGGRRTQPDRRDSILSDRTPTSCCNNRVCNWVRGICRRHSEHSTSRRPSEFSKNKSLSPTLPPEDNRKKLDTTLVEHTSVMRGAIPILPIVLAYFCLFCNIIVPGLGTILSGLFCLCFGIPRFGVHDGLKHRIGSFVINLLVGCGQLFTVLFCLVGWGWSIWWGVIFVKISRKYRKLKAEAAAHEAESAPPVTTNNHARP